MNQDRKNEQIELESLPQTSHDNDRLRFIAEQNAAGREAESKRRILQLKTEIKSDLVASSDTKGLTVGEGVSNPINNLSQVGTNYEGGAIENSVTWKSITQARSSRRIQRKAA